ncbi:MAG: (d)CMP kinase [Actinobacteria bacterium]|jgi:cytidylate kinase|nr:(d)CMP kinase [Actinomycetota bacterium]MBT3746764.1 (d)CMP kinase [Actinomycetota bacterium]MBT3969457.1 (d)CMP kinase [Actinomycetota bacterium]MBT4010177.1 (d)CMP kinase [Actinomycetota bacterium]MBT4302131.1 (d)CMP kinase [Actinomycetota bacterium]
MQVIAIDGPAGSGKSTVAKAVAARLGLAYLDTGAMYRAVAFAALSGGLNLADADAVLAVAQTLDLQLDQSSCVVNGVDATEAIRGTEVTQAVSVVAALPAVRAEMVQRQRQWAQDRNGGVMEGRDIGSVVFPDAALKIYLTASEEVRAQRRAAEAGGEDVAAVAADLGRRDEVDSQRKASPLVEAEGSVVVDTSAMTIDQVVDHVVGLLK